ncbi:UDP-glycosyltransferase 86A1-like [Salvia miltiorrhiza]|uniref:UDP-glycosyltransferase 86A1-like n=1 Tax=Salvia miltiorrhiza TaxID=226208 RepID=UPI0025AB6792|nr:UDP-glycosyltransferase 86A1-like [Salvia miltiorrhiza]
MAEKQKKAHAIMISMPYQGHITPFVSLALNLASKGIAITFVHLESVHHKLSKPHHKPDLFSDARQSGLDIRYATISDGFPLDYDRDLRPELYWTALLQTLPSYVDEFVGNVIRSDPHSLHFLIADTVYVWPAAVARKYNLLNVAFWTSPALVFSLLYHLDLLKERGHFLREDDEAEIDYVPGVGSLRIRDLMSSLSKRGDVTGNYLFKAFQEVKKADFVLHNTVEEVESDTLSALNRYQPTYAVGPIGFSGTSNVAVSKSLHAEVDITKWLGSKPAGSVLYVSFGSVVQTSKGVIGEIAHGLRLSEVNFIWVARAHLTASGDADVLPAGFVEEVEDRGLIVPWCDQISVLSDPAVGGFLTHCGWNSVVESMWCGVPMICFPVTYDQPTNRKLVVNDWEIGIDLGDAATLDREGVAEKIRILMSGDASERFRREAGKVKQMVRDAVEADGSSVNNFHRFVIDLDKKLRST